MVCPFKWTFVLLQVLKILRRPIVAYVDFKMADLHANVGSFSSLLVKIPIFCILGAKPRWLTLVEGQ